MGHSAGVRRVCNTPFGYKLTVSRRSVFNFNLNIMGKTLNSAKMSNLSNKIDNKQTKLEKQNEKEREEREEKAKGRITSKVTKRKNERK